MIFSDTSTSAKIGRENQGADPETSEGPQGQSGTVLYFSTKVVIYMLSMFCVCAICLIVIFRGVGEGTAVTGCC